MTGQAAWESGSLTEQAQRLEAWFEVRLPGSRAVFLSMLDRTSPVALLLDSRASISSLRLRGELILAPQAGLRSDDCVVWGARAAGGRLGTTKETGSSTRLETLRADVVALQEGQVANSPDQRPVARRARVLDRRDGWGVGSSPLAGCEMR